MKHLPNALTLLRLILAPVVAWAVWQAYSLPAEQGWALGGAIMFVVAALTDLFDGMAARAFNAHSKFGRIIDPLADKALVGLPLIALSIVALNGQWPLAWAIALSTAVIVGRDSLITYLRFTAKDGEGIRVSQLAKWKTTVELVAVAAPILLAAAPAVISGFVISEPMTTGWIALLGLAALLSAYTGAQYLTAKGQP